MKLGRQRLARINQLIQGIAVSQVLHQQHSDLGHGKSVQFSLGRADKSTFAIETSFSKLENLTIKPDDWLFFPKPTSGFLIRKFGQLVQSLELNQVGRLQNLPLKMRTNKAIAIYGS